MSREDQGGKRTPEDIKRDHERMQREAQNRSDRGGTEGGLDVNDQANIARQQRQPDEDRLEDRKEDEARSARWRREWAREREAEEAKRAAADQPEESILDSIEPTTTRERIAQAFGGGEAARSMRPAPSAQNRVLFLRIAGMGLSLAGLFLLWQALQTQGGQNQAVIPGGTAAPPSGSPITQAAPPVNGTGTANASFTKVSGPCNLASRFADRYSFAATNGALTLTQLSNNHASAGRIEPSGEFATMAAGQGYRGRISGTTAEGQHTYTADGCNEVYNFTMTFATPFLTGGTGVANRPPEAGPIQAQQVGTSTLYTVQNVRDPDGDVLRYAWTSTNPCGGYTGAALPVFTWSHPHPPCPDEAAHPGTITVVISDGRFAITRTYSRGSVQGTGGVPLAGEGLSTIPPSAVPTVTASAAVSASPTTTTTAGGPNVPLAGLGLVLVLAGLGLVLGGPMLAGGPVQAQADPCAREREREAAARARRDAARTRRERIDGLHAAAQSTSQESTRAAAAAAQATEGASSYVGNDGRTVYTNPAQRARIEAADAAATQARTAAAEAQRAYESAGGNGERSAASTEEYRADRDWRDADQSLRSCLGLFAPPALPTGGGGSAGPGGAAGPGGPVIAGGTDATQTRPGGCTQETAGTIRGETSTTHQFDMHDLGNMRIVVEGTRLNTDDSHARGFLGHLESVNKAFDAAKIGAGLAEGEIVGPALDAVEFPDFLSYFGGIRERLDAGMNDLLERLRQHRRMGEYTIEYTTLTFRITCRHWEECDGTRWVARSGSTLELVRSRSGRRGPTMITDEGERSRWIDGNLGALRNQNTQAERSATEFRENCR